MTPANTSASDSSANNSANNAANNAAAVTAFFYQNPVVLNREQHQGLRVKPADARFAARSQAVPLVAAEFPEAALEYPIVFAKGGDGQWLALALTGLSANRNAFVNAQGQWSARYVPASVRRYPFILAGGGKDAGGQGELSLAADLAAPHLTGLTGQGQEGEALFDAKGEPTEMTRGLMALLADFQTQAARTHALARQLDEAGVLTRQDLTVRVGGQSVGQGSVPERSAVVEGVWIVDEARLRELPDAKALGWFRTGELAALHAHMLSLRNLVLLLERSPEAGSAQAASPAGASSAASAPDSANAGKKPASAGGKGKPGA